MSDGQGPVQPQDGAAVTFRCLPSLPPQASSLKSVPQVRKPSFRPSPSLKSTRGISPTSSSDSDPPLFFGDCIQVSREVEFTKSGMVFTTSGGKHLLVRGGVALTPGVHRVLATRYKWRTACAKARESNTPEELFDAAMQHSLETLPAPGMYDSVRPPSQGPLLSHASFASLARPSPLLRPSPAAMGWRSSPALGSSRRLSPTTLGERRGTTPNLLRPGSVSPTRHVSRLTEVPSLPSRQDAKLRLFSVVDAPPPPSDSTPAAAATWSRYNEAGVLDTSSPIVSRVSRGTSRRGTSPEAARAYDHDTRPGDAGPTNALTSPVSHG
ncbi:hypothetical protein T484DRAFT_2016770 [Baffinella frigidus]|nr:hypothetical protein T484DRAFT_2016770 [Cryptophyta sp. CCMP2293]